MVLQPSLEAGAVGQNGARLRLAVVLPSLRGLENVTIQHLLTTEATVREKTPRLKTLNLKLVVSSQNLFMALMIIS